MTRFFPPRAYNYNNMPCTFYIRSPLFFILYSFIFIYSFTFIPSTYYILKILPSPHQLARFGCYRLITQLAILWFLIIYTLYLLYYHTHQGQWTCEDWLPFICRTLHGKSLIIFRLFFPMLRNHRCRSWGKKFHGQFGTAGGGGDFFK